MPEKSVLQLLVQAPLQAGGKLGMAAKGDIEPVNQDWHLARMKGAAPLHPGEAWEIAYQAASRDSVFAEPNFDQPWRWDRYQKRVALAARPGEMGSYEDQNPSFPRGPGFAWHLGDDFTQLAKARAEIEALGAAGRSGVRIGIIDVGFDFRHKALPQPPLLRLDLQRNFGGGDPNDASDPFDEGFLHQNQPGHGTGTLSILAGRSLAGMLRPEQNGVTLGGNPFAEIIPCRIGPGVVLAKTSAFVAAVNYLMAPKGDPSMRVDVISMSMGGLASEAWADVVNRAYEAGIVIVTAAGNNFGAPKSIVYPARFNRVLAACGVMADGSPYDLGFGAMSGNFGPDSKMKTAMATYTPNTPWAEVNAENIVDMNGSGTSAATPQIAAAAALWLNKYKNRLQYDQPWKVVEAVRNALFSSAKKPAPEHFEHFGNGILQAFDALQIRPAASAGLAMTPRDSASWEFFHLFEKPFGIAQTADLKAPLERMLNLELTQLFQRDAALEQIVPDPSAAIDAAARTKLLSAVAESKFASKVLRERCKQTAGARVQVQGAAGLPPSPPPAGGGFAYKQNQVVPVRPPEVRRLQAYGFDPSFSAKLDTVRLNRTTIEIPWDPDLKPGPVGEYVEVIDHDPATGCYYAPVDLNDPFLLASDGLAPSEGNPQFHQQMAYAVAMRTIWNFEMALGRRALWAPKNADGTGFVQRLRIYPHALRAQNAYYHPGKKALLLGYFPAASGDPKNVLPGGVVFTCLSHDVVAHETTHALLDGLYRHFNYPSNPDLLAFHEAFADMVAVFQHFSLPGVLESRIAAVGGSLRTDALMGDLAQEFGRGAGLRGSLRTALTVDTSGEDRVYDGVLRGRPSTDAENGDASGDEDAQLTGNWAQDLARGMRLQGTVRMESSPHKIDDRRIYEVWEPHDRGAILLGAVFDAFIRIYEFRTRDLIRLATGGQDKLPAGPVNYDLAVRLAGEAGKSAQHVLNMCIRGLDYCPPVDLTFGDYLRALITADVDMFPHDAYEYRVAFLEAFRARGIYPRGLRSMSVDSLIWRGTGEEHISPGGEGQRSKAPNLLKRMGLREKVRDFSDSFKRYYTRAVLHSQLKVVRKEFQDAMSAMSPEDMSLFGLEHGRPFDLFSLRLSERQGPYGRSVPTVVLSLTQERQVPLFEDDANGPQFTFEGGATVIIDPQYLKVKYVISKGIHSEERLRMQRDYLQNPQRSLRDLYFGDDPNQRFAMLHKGEL